MIQRTIIRLAETSSTNSYAMELIAREHPAESCIVQADFQTKGRGLDTNLWESEKEKNLTFSIILYPTFGAEHQFILNKAISLGIRDYLTKELSKYTISIKWPNDIYIDDRKACGILIQNSIIGNSLEYVVAGIGLNVNQILYQSYVPNPVSMKMITGIEYNLENVLNKLLDCIFIRYQQVNDGHHLAIEHAYHSALYRLMEWHNYFIKNNTVRARITGTNAFGQLLLESKTGEMITCDLKEVKFSF